MPKSIEHIETDAFYNCTSLEKIELPNSLTNIGDFAFYGCSSLSDVVIPDSVTYIGDAAYMYCVRLSNVAIPKSITYIGDVAFSGCPSLTDFYCYAENPEISSLTAFSGPYIGNTTLHVPETSLNNFKMVAPWNKFAEIVPIPGSRPIDNIVKLNTAIFSIQSFGGTLTIEGLEKGTPVVVYTTTGTEVANGVAEEDVTLTLETNLQKGDIAIVKAGAKSVKVVMK